MQDAVAHLSRLGVCGEDLGSLVEGDSGEGAEAGGDDNQNLAGIEDFSEIDEVNVPYIC